MAAFCIVTGAFSQAAVKSVEILDDRTGMTMGALGRPLAFTETVIFDLLVPDKQPSILYVGPVEWDRSGDLSYLLWIQLAPGVGSYRFDDISAHGVVTLDLDDGPVELSSLEDPVVASSPYRPIAPVGQTAYFPIDAKLLKRMASSRRLKLKVRAGDLTVVDFTSRDGSNTAIQQFMVDRGVPND